MWNRKLSGPLILQGVCIKRSNMVFYRAFESNNIVTTPSYSTGWSNWVLKAYTLGGLSILAFYFRILRCEIWLSASKYWNFKPCSSHGRKGVFSLHNRFIYKYSYSLHEFLLCRVARRFHLLPPEVMMADASKSFKAKLSKIDVLSILYNSGYGQCLCSLLLQDLPS